MTRRGIGSKNLLGTTANVPHGAAAVTWPGQAFWGNSGPRGKTCRLCSFWRGGSYREAIGSLRDASCAKFESLMAVDTGPQFPHSACACKYFMEKADPPPVNRV